jgi:hypothetical protein
MMLARCPICELEEETGFHIMWDCPSARDVWGGSLKKFQQCMISGCSFGQVVDFLHKNCEEEELSLFVGFARRIWVRLNEFVHNGKFLHPNKLLQ